MKKTYIFGSTITVLGLLIAFGPHFLFKICGHGETAYPHCFWSAQAETGVGLLIAALGVCAIVFSNLKTQLGLVIGVLLSAFVALAVPNFLIGGCGSMAMACRKIAFPALTAESVLLLILSACLVMYMTTRKPSDAPENNG